MLGSFGFELTRTPDGTVSPLQKFSGACVCSSAIPDVRFIVRIFVIL
jgi:hypothetical protein